MMDNRSIGAVRMNRAGVLLHLWLAFAILIALVADNSWIFGPKIAEDGDYAANSLLVQEAKSLSLTVGNYSKFRFHHPGPFYLYVQAAGEVAFHDLLGVVQSPYQGQLLGVFVLNAFCYSLALLLLVRALDVRSMTPAIIAWAALVASTQGPEPSPLLGWSGMSSSWMPCLYVATFMLFLASAYAVARNVRGAFIWMFFGGGALVHGHVSFALFVPVLAALAIGLRARAARSGRSAFWPSRTESLISLSVLFLFVAPIAYHTIAHFPGEMQKYLAYQAPAMQERSLWRAIEFVCTFLGSDQKMFGGLLVLSAFALSFAPQNPPDARRPLFVIVVVAVLLCVLYAWKSVDSYSDPYTLQFAFAVPMILVAAAAAWIWEHNAMAPKRAMYPWSVLALPILLLGNFGNPYRGSPLVPAAAERLRAEAAAGTNSQLGLEFEAGDWPFVLGVLANAERDGVPACVLDRSWEFMVTPANICDGAPARTRIFRVQAAASGSTVVPVGQ